MKRSQKRKLVGLQQVEHGTVVHLRRVVPLVPGGPMLRVAGVLEYLPICRSTLYNWIRNGKFPQPEKAHDASSISWWKPEAVIAFLNDHAKDNS